MGDAIQGFGSLGCGLYAAWIEPPIPVPGGEVRRADPALDLLGRELVLRFIQKKEDEMDMDFHEELNFVMEINAAIADLHERYGIRGILTHAAMAAVGEYCILQAREGVRPEANTFGERLEEFDWLVEEIATAEDPRAALLAAAAATLMSIIKDPDLPSLHRALAVLVLVYLAARDRREGQGSTFQAALAAMEAVEALSKLLEEGDPG